jgi:hypothetical protein
MRISNTVKSRLFRLVLAEPAGLRNGHYGGAVAWGGRRLAKMQAGAGLG